jgi:hypothetical protein
MAIPEYDIVVTAPKVVTIVQSPAVEVLVFADEIVGELL